MRGNASEASAQANVIAADHCAVDSTLWSELSVSSGEVKTSKGQGVLRASAIGSCVVVTAYDPGSGVGGMAHVMLPGAARHQSPEGRTRHAEDAIEVMIQEMTELGANQTRAEICLVGGANVLGDGHDSPGPEIVRSLAEILDKKEITPAAMEVGGTQRRSCALDVARGRVTYTVGDSGHRALCEADARCPGPNDKTRRKVFEGEREVTR